MPAPTEEKRVDESRALEGFPCKLGDVILRSAGDEAWLAGALVLSEAGGAVAALFTAPEAGGDRAIYARAASEELLWLAAEPGVAVISGEPPTALEISGERYERRRRLPLRAARIGTGAPEIGPEVIVAEYTGLGDQHLVVVASKDKTLAFRGDALGPGTYDVLPKPASE